MNFINFNPRSDLTEEKKAWWDDWCKRAVSNTENVLAQANSGRRIKFNQKIWSELKAWLLEYVFNGKCAYCESKLNSTDYGDADHYRPKNRVSIQQGNGNMVISKDGIKHPGYFWIAYNWKNLFPSCKRCNTERKLDLFPVENEHVFNPDVCENLDVDEICDVLDKIEKPLLLNPYRGGELHPRNHLYFDKYGVVSAKNESKAGKASIDIYKLGRPELVEERRDAQKNAGRDLSVLFMNDASESEIDEFLSQFENGSHKYSAAILDFLEYKLNYMDRCRRRLRRP